VDFRLLTTLRCEILVAVDFLLGLIIGLIQFLNYHIFYYDSFYQ
jgi:hypothetical protein